MKKKKVILGAFGIVAILLIIVLAGCLSDKEINDKSESDFFKFIGSWTAVARPLPISTTYNFREDGTVTHKVSYAAHYEQEDQIKNGTFTVENGNLIIRFENSEQQVFRYIFSKNDNYVTLLDDTFDVEENPNVLQFTWMK